MSKLNYSKIIKNFLSFAKDEESIRAAIIVGSQARQEKTADQWSDLDLVIFSTDHTSLLKHYKWIYHISKPMITFLEKTAVGGGMERRVLFEGGLDVDFAIFPTSTLDDMLNQKEVSDVFSRGVKVLIDKDHRLKSIIPQKNKTPVIPSKEKIMNDMHDFWYHSVLTAKKLRRGEILLSKSICDSYMKNLLVSLIKTEIKLRKGPDYDTWHGFRFFEQWADPDIIESFKKLYAPYDEKEIWHALIKTMNVYEKMAKKVCHSMGIEYPLVANRYAVQLVEKMLNEIDLK